MVLFSTRFYGESTVDTKERTWYQLIHFVWLWRRFTKTERAQFPWKLLRKMYVIIAFKITYQMISLLFLELIALTAWEDIHTMCTWTKFQFLWQNIFGTFLNIFLHNSTKKQRMRMKLTVLESWINFLQQSYTGQSVFLHVMCSKM